MYSTAEIDFHRVTDSIPPSNSILQDPRDVLWYENARARVAAATRIYVFLPLFSRSNGNVSFHIRPDARNVLRPCQYTFPKTRYAFIHHARCNDIRVYVRNLSLSRPRICRPRLLRRESLACSRFADSSFSGRGWIGGTLPRANRKHCIEIIRQSL